MTRGESPARAVTEASILTTEYVHPELGAVTIACDGRAIVGAWFSGQKYFGANLLAGAQREDDAPVLARAKAWLDAYFSGARPDPRALPLSPRGTDFQRRVWRMLVDIPYGQTRTYGELARELAANGRGASARAVGAANGRNPISIIVPCHRLISASGSLTGYAGGIARKLWLLNHEGVDTSRLSVPARGTAL